MSPVAIAGVLLLGFILTAFLRVVSKGSKQRSSFDPLTLDTWARAQFAPVDTRAREILDVLDKNQVKGGPLGKNIAEEVNNLRKESFSTVERLSKIRSILQTTSSENMGEQAYLRLQQAEAQMTQQVANAVQTLTEFKAKLLGAVAGDLAGEESSLHDKVLELKAISVSMEEVQNFMEVPN